MHKLKSSARHQAWYGDDDSPNFNPYAKFRPRNSRGDLENGLGRTQSEGTSTGAAEQLRRDELGSPAINHPHTMPTSPAIPQPSGSYSSIQAPVPEDQPVEHTSATKDNSKDNSESSKAATSETLTAADQGPGPVDESHGLRKRRKNFLGKFRRNKQVDPGSDKDRQNTSSSKPKHKYTVKEQFRATIFNSWINLLLVFVPIGIALNFVKTISPVAVFVTNFVAIIPLAALLSYATEEIACHVGETIGGLLNASFGNAVELIVSIIALFHDEIVIVQTSLIGSMLSNLLLVLGMCFLFGGWTRVEQHFNVVVAQTASSLLALAIGSLIIPTAFGRWANLPGTADDASVQSEIIQLSRGTAILLLLTYGCYLFFQLRTHVELYNEPSKKAKKRTHAHSGEKGGNASAQGGVNGGPRQGADQGDADNEDGGEEREQEEATLSVPVALFTLCASTALVGVCSEFLVDSINALTTITGVSETFVGLILLPIVGNAAEHATSVTVACKDKMDLAIGVAVGSSMQIALLVLPLVVTIGWIAGKQDMDLDFDAFQVIVLFVAVLLVNYLIGDGKSHWLEGIMLCILYLIIAVAAWFFPNGAEMSGQVNSS